MWRTRWWTVVAAFVLLTALGRAQGPTHSLSVYGVNLDLNPNEGSHVRVRATVRNTSAQALAKVTLSFVLWDDDTPTVMDNLTGEAVGVGPFYCPPYETTVENLQAGEVRQIEITTTIAAPERIDNAEKRLTLEVTHRKLRYGIIGQSADALQQSTPPDQANTLPAGSLQVFNVTLEANPGLKVRASVRNTTTHLLSHVVVVFVLWDEGIPTAPDPITGELIMAGEPVAKYPCEMRDFQPGETKPFYVETFVYSPHEVDSAHRMISVDARRNAYEALSLKHIYYGFKGRGKLN